MHTMKTTEAQKTPTHIHMGMMALGFTVLAMIDALFGGFARETVTFGINEYAAFAIVGIVSFGVYARESLIRPSLVRTHSRQKL